MRRCACFTLGYTFLSYGSFGNQRHWRGHRDQLREQHQLSEEIAQAITNTQIGDQADETELDAELEGLEQEAMDERMLHTGTVPVADQLNRLPAAANGERKFTISELNIPHSKASNLILNYSQRQIEGTRGRRRGSRTGEAARRDGHVINHFLYFTLSLPSCLLSSLC